MTLQIRGTHTDTEIINRRIIKMKKIIKMNKKRIFSLEEYITIKQAQPEYSNINDFAYPWDTNFRRNY